MYSTSIVELYFSSLLVTFFFVTIYHLHLNHIYVVHSSFRTLHHLLIYLYLLSCFAIRIEFMTYSIRSCMSCGNVVDVVVLVVLILLLLVVVVVTVERRRGGGGGRGNEAEEDTKS